MNTFELAKVDLESILEDDFVCGYDHHDEGLFGHIPEQLASWYITLPCGHEGVSCDGWVQAVLTADGYECDRCGRTHWRKQLKKGFRRI